MSWHALASEHGRAGVNSTCISIVPVSKHAIASAMQKTCIHKAIGSW